MPWYVKKTSNEVFGPVALNVLKHWAADGRIAPDDSLSEDQDAWTPAAELSDLSMDWILELGEGQPFGPLHAMCVVLLLEEGQLNAQAVVRHKDTEETFQAWELGLKTAIHGIAQLRTSMDAMHARLSEAESKLAAQPEVVAHSAETLEEIDRGRYAKEAAKWKHLYEEDASKTATEIQALKEKVREIDQQRKDAQREADLAKTQLSQAEQRLKAMQKEGGDGSESINALMQASDELSRNYDALLKQVDAKNDEIQTLAESRRRAEDQAKTSVEEMSARLQREQEEADTARTRFVELEQSHLQLVKVYRELNDRYIRLRQEGPPPMSSPSSLSSNVASQNLGRPDKEKKKSKIRLN